MNCPKCGCQERTVVDSRTREDGTNRRRRECYYCRYRFTTLEVNIEEYEDLKVLEDSLKKLLTLANK